MTEDKAPLETQLMSRVLSRSRADGVTTLPIPTAFTGSVRWRVTGQPAPHHSTSFPPYHHEWGEREDEARSFVAKVRSRGVDERGTAAGWVSGPFLEKRIVLTFEPGNGLEAVLGEWEVVMPDGEANATV